MNIDIAHQIVSGQFVEFTDLNPELLGQGWDNLCILYANGVVFRIPTRKMGGEIILNEIAALPKMVGKLPLPVPDFQFLGRPSSDYPYHFVGYPHLAGETSEQWTWDSTQRTAAVAPLAQFLLALHSMPVGGDVLADTIKRSDPEALLKRIRMRHEQIAGAWPSYAAQADVLLELANELRQSCELDEQECIVHGDLYPRHILANEKRQITGVIDWGDINLGSPAGDLSLAYTFFESTEREAFWDSYELDVSENTKRIARLRAINYAVALLAYGLDSEDKAVTAMSLDIARRATKG